MEKKKNEYLNVILPDTPLKEKAEAVHDTLGNVKAKPSTRWPKRYNRQTLRETSTHYAMSKLRHWSTVSQLAGKSTNQHAKCLPRQRNEAIQ